VCCGGGGVVHSVPKRNAPIYFFALFFFAFDPSIILLLFNFLRWS